MGTAIDDSAGPLSLDVPGGRRILVVDDHAVVQLGFRLLLARQRWVHRTLQATTPSEAVALAREFQPHLSLVDVLLGEASGLDVSRDIREVSPNTIVLLMSGGGPVAPSTARMSGASGFVAKDWPPDLLLRAIQRALDGRPVFPVRKERGESSLTPRELDVLRAISQGMSNPEVARELQLSPHTIKQYTSSVYRKLEARNRADAVRCAQRRGLIY